MQFDELKGKYMLIEVLINLKGYFFVGCFTLVIMIGYISFIIKKICILI